VDPWSKDIYVCTCTHTHTHTHTYTHTHTHTCNLCILYIYTHTQHMNFPVSQNIETLQHVCVQHECTGTLTFQKFCLVHYGTVVKGEFASISFPPRPQVQDTVLDTCNMCTRHTLHRTTQYNTQLCWYQQKTQYHTCTSHSTIHNCAGTNTRHSGSSRVCEIICRCRNTHSRHEPCLTAVVGTSEKSGSWCIDYVKPTYGHYIESLCTSRLINNNI
jgi:hypothetical protein